MKIVFIALFLCFTSFVFAEESQTQTNPSPAFTVEKKSIDQRLYGEQDFPPDTFAGLTAAQKKQALTALNANPCTCGCKNDTIAKCRIKDPNCGTAPKLVVQVLDLIKEGKNSQEVAAVLASTRPKPKPKTPPTVSVPVAEELILVPFREDDPYKGPVHAKVTIIDFSEFQCPVCKRVLTTLKEIQALYGDNVKIVWKHQPLAFHNNAFAAAEAAEAAREQGKFWEMHDLLFESQTSLNPSTFEAAATKLDLNLEKFRVSISEHRNKSRIEEDAKLGKEIGANGTPTFFINGRKVVGAYPLEIFKKILDEELAKADQLLKSGHELDSEFYKTVIEANQKALNSASSK